MKGRETMDNRCGYGEKLVLYHFGELGKSEAAEVEAHVLSCQACNDELKGISALDGLTFDAPSQGEVYRAVEGVMKGISPDKRSLGRRLIPAYIAAGTVILAVFFATYMPNIGGNNAPREEQQQVAMAQADWEVLENLDVIGDIDVIVQMDKEGLDEIGPIRD